MFDLINFESHHFCRHSCTPTTVCTDFLPPVRSVKYLIKLNGQVVQWGADGTDKRETKLNSLQAFASRDGKRNKLPQLLRSILHMQR